MKLFFDSGNWEFSSPSGGNGTIMDSDHARLFGLPLSYGTYDCKVPLTMGWVKLKVQCQTEGLSSPENLVTVMLSLHSVDGTPLRRLFTDVKPGGKRGSLVLSRLFEVPANIELFGIRADVAYGVVTLGLRWPGNGSAVFSSPELIVSEPPSERKARVVVTYFGYKPGSITDRVTSIFGEIGTCSPDIVCLREALFSSGPPDAEPIGGPVTSLMSEMAVKYKTYVTGHFTEADNGYMFNTSALFNRSGSLVGKYRKVHLALGEVERGTSPGSEFPVFETEFARVGLSTCWDAAFPETARCLRLNGAELMISSTMGDFWETDMAHARENGLWYAIAGVNRNTGGPYPPSRIIDPEGTLLCGCGSGYDSDSHVYADIDFNRRYFQWWLSVGPCEGEGPSLYKLERRPDAYGSIVCTTDIR